MHSNIYSYLFHDENIKEESIIDTEVSWTEVNVVTSLQIKERKTHLFVCVWSQNLQKIFSLCYKKKNTKLIAIIGWLACNELTWKLYTVIKTACE